jgi:CheY-like chemotaxis protein
VKNREIVLVVDDDPHFRELYRTALQFRGFTVATASDGMAALQSIQAECPAIVILDLNMPCVDGWAVLRELASNEQTKAIPVIVVTAADVTRAVGQAVAILRKPVLPDQVLPLIERHLRRAS